MTKKDKEMVKFATFLSENPQFLEQFKNIDPKDIKAVTKPNVYLTGGANEMEFIKLTPKQVEELLLMHPVIPRGIDIRANRITGRGYKVVPANEGKQAKEARDKMFDLLEVSGGEILINSLTKDAFGFGNGYITLLTDKNTDEVVMLSKEHPIFFRIARNKKEDSGSLYGQFSAGDWATGWGGMKINSTTKRPEAYTQVVFDRGKHKVEPYGQEIKANRVAHLVFDVWGDEVEGIGLVQYVQNVLKYLMNIEEAGSEAIYRAGFTQKVVNTDVISEKDLKKIAKNLRDINTSDAIILPKGTEVTNLQPGQSQFAETHELLLNLVAIRMGVPKPILTLDGTSTNKATMRELMRDLSYDLRADEMKIINTIEEQIFKPACQSIFGDDFEDYPKFVFNDFDEGKEEKANILNTTSEYVMRFTDSYEKLRASGATEAADKVLALMLENLPNTETAIQTSKVGIEEKSTETEEKTVEKEDNSEK